MRYDPAYLGILFFMALGVMFTIIAMQYLASADPQAVILIMFFITMIVVLTNIGLFMFAYVQVERGRPALTLLGEVAKRAELVMRFIQPLIDFLWEVSYRFEYDTEKRREKLLRKLEELERQTATMVPQEQGGFFRRLARAFGGRESGLQPLEELAPSNPCRHLGYLEVRGDKAVCSRCGRVLRIWVRETG